MYGKCAGCSTGTVHDTSMQVMEDEEEDDDYPFGQCKKCQKWQASLNTHNLCFECTNGEDICECCGNDVIVNKSLCRSCIDEVFAYGKYKPKE